MINLGNERWGQPEGMFGGLASKVFTGVGKKQKSTFSFSIRFAATTRKNAGWIIRTGLGTKPFNRVRNYGADRGHP